MKDLVLKERMKELIGDRRVEAALFYSFNFEAEFFENYVLPLFLPQAPFGDNKIQNSILWRKYQHELPPVCVYCDFHAKKPEAPTLKYDIRLIDLPKGQGYKPCFHLKHSYILLDDNSLITLVGSNNLTNAGWCSNLEGVVEIVFKNGEFFPRAFKDQFRDLLFDLKKLDPDLERPLAEAEERIRRFLYKAKYTDEVTSRLYNSGRQTFFDFLSEARRDFNSDEPFQVVEVLSPYYAPAAGHIQELKALFGVDEIQLSIPFENTSVVGMEETLFDSYRKAGIIWSRVIAQEKEKGYRFNHSKIYRLLGREKMVTIVGSVNCTEAAFKGRKAEGNLETAVLLVSDARDWQPALQPTSVEGFSYSGNKAVEDTIADRMTVPSIEFTLDWVEKQLHYRWLEAVETGQIQIGETNYPANDAEGKVHLKSPELQLLADNAVILFRYKRTDFHFFPIQIGIEARPLSTKLQLSDRQLLQLWSNFGEDQVQGEALEKIVESLTREADGEMAEISTEAIQSTMNLMAAHMSALIRLERNLFQTGKTKLENQKLQHLREYYLYTDNVDTLTGYSRLLIDLNEKMIITNGFFWLLLELIKTNFYVRHKIQKESEFYALHQDRLTLFSAQQGKLKNKMEGKGVTRAQLNWIKEMLAS